MDERVSWVLGLGDRQLAIGVARLWATRGWAPYMTVSLAHGRVSHRMNDGWIDGHSIQGTQSGFWLQLLLPGPSPSHSGLTLIIPGLQPAENCLLNQDSHEDVLLNVFLFSRGFEFLKMIMKRRQCFIQVGNSLMQFSLPVSSRF